MKCPGCSFALTEPVRRKHDSVRIVGERPLLDGESLICFRCRKTIVGVSDLAEYCKEANGAVVLGNEGGIVFACPECAHTEIKEALAPKR